MPPHKQARRELDDGAAIDSAVQAARALGSLSLNPIFACSAPRAGVLSVAGGRRALAELLDTIDDSVYQVLDSAWEAVGVPAADYWCARPQQAAAITARHAPSGAADVPPAKQPDPRALADSFYSSRLTALRGRGYRKNNNAVVVAVDRRVGNGSKLFNVLSRSSVADFVSSIPRPHDRSLYVLLDEQAPLDPYFDIDCSYTQPEGTDLAGSAAATAFSSAFPWWATHGSASPVSAVSVEKLLHTILVFLQRYVEKHLGTQVEQCLVLTSCLQVARSTGDAASVAAELLEMKLSFHVHFRLHQRHAVASVRDMHLFMAQLRARLDAVLRSDGGEGAAEPFAGVVTGPENLREVAAMIRQCVDFGVYSRWRAFRLPYNVKTPFATAAGSAAAFTVADAAVDDLLASQVAHSGAVAELPDSSVGAAANALVQSVLFSADPALRAAQQRLVRSMSYLLRFLLPVVAGVTPLQHDPLKTFLETYAPRLPPQADSSVSNKERFGAAVMELAMIQRDDHPVDRDGEDVEGVLDRQLECTGGLQLLRFPGHEVPTEYGQGVIALREADTTTASLESRAVHPFTEALPPMPHSVRVIVTNPSTKELLAEVFACLAPQFCGIDPASSTEAHEAHQSFGFALPTVASNQRVTGDRINAQYEESIRAYYVLQKQCKYCLRQARVHKSTYAQLYLTYGSIKVRCYANDCCERCLFIPWKQPNTPPEGAQFAAGFPKYERLVAIRDQLFPPLPLDELVRRYGPHVLDEIRKQQQQPREPSQATAAV